MSHPIRPCLPRAEAEAILLGNGYMAEEITTMSDNLADWIATGLTDPRRGQPSWLPPVSRPSSTAEPDDPTGEEIAHAANLASPPLRHLAATRVARETKRAALVVEGRQLAGRNGLSDATLMALANLVRAH